MPHPFDPAALARHRVLAGALLIGGLLVLLAMLATNIARQLDVLGASSIDNVQWTLSQMDVELLTLEIVVDDARHAPGRLDEVRKRFDIAYSRFNTLQAGGLFNSLRQSRGFAGAFAALEGFMTRSVPLIDGPDDALQEALPRMKGELRQLIPEAHRLGTLGVEIFAHQADATRTGIKSALVGLAVLSGALLFMLLGLVGGLVRSSRLSRQRATEAAQTASRLDAVIRASLDPVITLNEAGRITDFSPAGRQVFGHDPVRIRGQKFDLLVPPDAPGQPLLRLNSEPAAPERLRVTARHASGREFPAEISVSPLMAGGRQIFVVFLSDLSRQVEAEQALMGARDAALAGEKAKADLLVVMSHEIRTPLNGMIGTIDLMQATALSPQQREYLRIMTASGRLLMNHVNNILDMARLDSGKAELALGPVDLGQLIAEVAANQRPASAAQGNRLEVKIAPDCPLQVVSDAGRLRQVLLNLVGNAVKFTRDGTITVTLDAPDAEGRFGIAVADTGIGIAPADMERIFEDFVTLDPSFARQAAGTGLGLGIVRRIVEQMGGTVAAESVPGQGSTFRLRLPLGVAAPPKPATGERLHLLVVEDNEFNRLITREMLRQDGHSVREARDGEEGLRLAAEEAFDLILMDISMPGLDGIEATARLRQGPGPNAATPVLALTAHALPADIRRFQAAGMQDAMLKPLQIATLRAALAEHVPGARPPLTDAETLTQMDRTLPPEVVASLTQRFLQDMETRLARLVADPDPEAMRKEAHHMAGSAGVFGAKALGAALERFLGLLRAEEVEAARATLPALSALWTETAAAYRPPSRDQASSLR